MPSFSTEVPHSLGQAAAQDRLTGFLERIVEQYRNQLGEVDGVWEGNTLNYRLTTYGMKINGKVTVTEDKVQADGNLPFAALVLKSKITDGIRDALQAALA